MMNDPLCVWLDTFDEDGFKDELLVPLDIYTAASIGNCASISEALEVNGDLLHVRNKGGWTALMYAAYYGHHEAVVLLLSRGASLHDKTPEGLTPLMLAASCGHAETVKGLIKSGSILEARDKRSWTAIFHAVNSRHCSVLELLLKSGANPMACEPDRGETALQSAIRTSDVDLVSLLLRYGADATVPDHEGLTPYALASQLRYATIADAIARAVATRGIVESLTPRRPKLEAGEVSRCDKDPDVSLEQLLSEAGLEDYLKLFDQQEVDLLVFLSLTDADLKECGVSKLGPRRKMTALIARWHRDAPLCSTQETAYADKLSVELQELQLKNSQLVKDNKSLLLRLHQEQELRLSTESLVVEARARLYKCHGCCKEAAVQLQHIYDTVLTAADYCEHSACRGVWQSLAPPESHRILDTNSRTEIKCLTDTRLQNVTVAAMDGKTNGYQCNEVHKPVYKEEAEIKNSLTNGETKEYQIKAPHKPVYREEPGIAEVLSMQRKLTNESEVVEFLGEIFVPAQEEVLASRKMVRNLMVNVKEKSQSTQESRGREFYSGDLKNCIPNDSKVHIIPNFSNNVDNVNSFMPATNIFNEGSTFPGETKSVSSQEPSRNTYMPVRDDSFLTEEIRIPGDYWQRPPALCIPRLGGPVKECLELLKSSVAMSDPNNPRPLTAMGLGYLTTGLRRTDSGHRHASSGHQQTGSGHQHSGSGHQHSGSGHQHSDSGQTVSGASKFLDDPKICSQMPEKLNVVEQSKGPKSYFEQPHPSVDTTSPAASSALSPEMFSSGDSRLTSSNEHNPSVGPGSAADALRAAVLTRLLQQTSISETVQNN